MVVGWLANKAVASATSLPMQYLGLAGYVVAEAIIFVPLLFIAEHYAPGAIQSAALVTALGFCGLSAIVFLTRKDFSFMRGLVYWGFIIALVAIVASLYLQFVLGTFFLPLP